MEGATQLPLRLRRNTSPTHQARWVRVRLDEPLWRVKHQNLQYSDQAQRSMQPNGRVAHWQQEQNSQQQSAHHHSHQQQQQQQPQQQQQLQQQQQQAQGSAGFAAQGPVNGLSHAHANSGAANTPGTGDSTPGDSDLNSSNPPTEAELTKAILTICSQLELLCRRLDVLEAKSNADPFCGVLRARANHMEKRLRNYVRRLVGPEFPNAESDYLLSRGLETVFPRAIALFMGKRGQSSAIQRTAFDSYLSQLAMMNQVFALAQQLEKDVTSQNRNHKYIAHQIALLYQCVSQAGDHLGNFKASIEAHFSQLKTATKIREGMTAPPKLPKDLREWIGHLTRQIVKELARHPSPLLQPLDPVRTLVTNHFS